MNVVALVTGLGVVAVFAAAYILGYRHGLDKAADRWTDSVLRYFHDHKE